MDVDLPESLEEEAEAAVRDEIASAVGAGGPGGDRGARPPRSG
jgi:hypothetical protein